MKLLSKVTSRLRNAVLAVLLMGATLTPMFGLIAPAAVSAAPCSISTSGGGGAGLLSLTAVAAIPDSTVQKVGFEVTPSLAWGSPTDAAYGSLSFADGSCASLNSSVSISIDKDEQLKVSFYDSGRTGAFVATTDYDNVISGGLVASTSNTAASFTYTVPTITAGVAQLVSVDLSNSGWVDLYLKQGSGSEVLLVSFKAATGTASYLGYNGTFGPSMTFENFDEYFSSCDDMGASQTNNSASARVLFDGSAATLALGVGGLCTSFDTSSYDSGTKTATLAYDTAGAAVNHDIKYATGDASKAKTTNTAINATSSLTLTTNGGDFKDYFSSGAGTKQLYFTTKESTDGKVIPKDTPWPIAGGIFDLGATVDISSVVFDTSPTAFSAVAHNLAAKTKDGSFTLYIPYKDKDNFVGLCVGAADIAAVSSKCTGIYYLKDGQTKKNSDTKSIPTGREVKAAIITVGTKKFWQVDGLTGTGGFSTTLASDPDTGVSINTASMPVVIAVMAVTIGVAFAARRQTAKKR